MIILAAFIGVILGGNYITQLVRYNNYYIPNFKPSAKQPKPLTFKEYRYKLLGI